MVYVHGHDRSEIPAFSEVREQLETDWMADMEKKLNDKYIEDLMSRYEIVFEDNTLQ